MEWEIILADSVKNGTIKELYLKKIPVLRTCNNWKDVEPIGWVDHRMKFSHYKGGLVKLGEKLFFVQEKTINALRPFLELKFHQKVQILKD